MVELPRVEMNKFNEIATSRPNNFPTQTLGKSGFKVDSTARYRFRFFNAISVLSFEDIACKISHNKY